MPETESTPSRRTLLRTATLALASGVAGCTSLTGGGQGPSQSNQTPASNTTPTDTETATATPAPTDTPQATPTQTPTQTEETTPTQTTPEAPDRSFPFLHRASGTTGYGIELQGNPVQGMNDAPVDMYYWSDYTCPYCQKFALDIHPKIAKNAVANGDLRVVFLGLPYKTENSWPAAILATCVWKQVSDTDPNLYWKWHHAVFKHQKEPGSGWADLEKLFKITQNVGIDTGPLVTCIETRQDQITQDIKAEIAAADRAHLTGTPAFVLYNKETGRSKKVIGTQPYSVFERNIRSIQS